MRSMGAPTKCVMLNWSGMYVIRLTCLTIGTRNPANTLTLCYEIWAADPNTVALFGYLVLMQVNTLNTLLAIACQWHQICYIRVDITSGVRGWLGLGRLPWTSSHVECYNAAIANLQLCPSLASGHAVDDHSLFLVLTWFSRVIVSLLPLFYFDCFMFTFIFSRQVLSYTRLCILLFWCFV